MSKTCSFCNKTLENASNRRRHERTMHPISSTSDAVQTEVKHNGSESKPSNTTQPATKLASTRTDNTNASANTVTVKQNEAKPVLKISCLPRAKSDELKKMPTLFGRLKDEQQKDVEEAKMPRRVVLEYHFTRHDKDWFKKCML